METSLYQSGSRWPNPGWTGDGYPSTRTELIWHQDSCQAFFVADKERTPFEEVLEAFVSSPFSSLLIRTRIFSAGYLLGVGKQICTAQ
jgi:hypothetical protein